ncbi:lipid A deacylase LpxR family protein [Moritella marina ATCC 15381]|uniref:Lipid A deacylase LpxR family protein n=1 Tax=Moritella marina ATCC 15381 TaxID=1202962 RepID=A0A5J6WPN4_MORMI|nr:lipid A deacylase LpxR family protein [Moritella marina ATCC 15381]
MKYHIFIILVFSLIAAFSSVKASTHPTVAFAIDNDAVLGVDEDYSNGIFSSYTSGQIDTPSILTFLSLSMWGHTALDKMEFMLGHKIWTPADIEIATPITNDRPYAGYLYSEFNFISLQQAQAQRFNLTIGTTGENSFSEQAQKLVHTITGSRDPNGWEYQIEDNVVGSIGYLTHFNLSRNALSERYFVDNAEFEISNISEVNIGNFRSDIASGIMLRWGREHGRSQYLHRTAL